MRELPHAERLDRALDVSSRAIEHGTLWLCCCAAGLALDRGRREAWMRAALAVGITEASSNAVKVAVRRERPRDAVVVPGSRYSFPSAHSATTTAAAMAFPRGPRWARIGLVVLTGLSRPYLGVHFPSDVVAGALLGWAGGALTGARS